VRARTLLLHHLPKAREGFELVDRRRLAIAPTLAEQVGLLMVDELEGELVSIATEEAPRAEGVAPPRLEHVAADDSDHPLAQRVRIPKAQQRSGGEVCADLVVPALGKARLRVVVQTSVGPSPGDARLAKVVEERREPHREREAAVGRGLHDGEGVLVDGEVVVAALLVEADRRTELGEELDENARVARQP
jgi:hypothetical protein